MKYSYLILVLFFSVTASANPLRHLKKTIRRTGHILYTTPLSSSGSGTLVGGSPKAISIVANAQRCFPDFIKKVPTELRTTQDVDLGSISQTTDFSGKIGLDLLKFMNTANSIFKIGIGFDSITSVELNFEGAKLEYMETYAVEDFYRNKMTKTCKSQLETAGFVIQALRVDKMRYSFKNKSGGYIDLNADGVSQYFDIDLNVKYHIEKNYTLVIDTPKYIGYQLGRLQSKDNGVDFSVASTTFLNRFKFKSIDLFHHRH